MLLSLFSERWEGVKREVLQMFSLKAVDCQGEGDKQPQANG